MAGKRIAVIGGGVSGLAAAHRIVEAGGEVVLFEAQSRVGGVVESSRAGGFLREHAANGFLSNAPDGALALCLELGVPVTEASSAARRRWIFVDGRLQELPAGGLDLVSTELLSWRGKLRALAEPLARRAETDDESVAAFFRRRMGGEVVRSLVEPFVTGIYAGDPEQLSIRAAFPRLAALDREGGLAVGMLGKLMTGMLAGTRGEKTAQERTRLWAPEAGMAALPGELARRLGDRVQLGAPVIAVDGTPGRARVRFGDGSSREFDRVVVALPAPAAARLVSDASAELARVLDQFVFARVAVVHLGYARADIGHPLDGFGFLVARGEPLDILGCVFESTLWPDRAGQDRVLLRCMLGGAHDPGALERSDDELVARARAAVRDQLAATGEPQHVHVVRWPRAVAQYTIGHLDRVARADELAGSLGLILAGSSYRGVSINDCIASARRVAEAAIDHP